MNLSLQKNNLVTNSGHANQTMVRLLRSLGLECARQEHSGALQQIHLLSLLNASYWPPTHLGACDHETRPPVAAHL